MHYEIDVQVRYDSVGGDSVEIVVRDIDDGDQHWTEAGRAIVALGRGDTVGEVVADAVRGLL